MSLINVKDLVGESCVVNGLGNVKLGGALSEGRTFASAYINGANLIPVKIEEFDGGKNVIRFEYSLCTYDSVLNELVRNTVRRSSNNNNPVTFGARAKRAFVFVPGEDLSTVAFTGQYTDIIGAPVRLIPFLFPGATTPWTINHNLGRPLPPFRVLNSAGEQLIVSAEDQIGFNTTIINFSTPQSGGIYFN